MTGSLTASRASTGAGGLLAARAFSLSAAPVCLDAVPGPGGVLDAVRQAPVGAAWPQLVAPNLPVGLPLGPRGRGALSGRLS